MKFIGIDLAWTYKNETGLCVIDESGHIEYLDAKVYSDEDMIDVIMNYADDDLCIAVDAPLVLENEKGAREADRLLTKARIHGHQLKLFMANRNFFIRSYGLVRGEVFAKKLAEALESKRRKTIEFGFTATSGRNIMVETFPTGICCGLFPEIYPVKYKVKHKVSYTETNAALRKVLSRICLAESRDENVNGVIEHFDFSKSEITKKEHKHIEDKMDAFLCAFGQLSIYKGYAKAMCFGDIKDGFITIPVADQQEGES